MESLVPSDGCVLLKTELGQPLLKPGSSVSCFEVLCGFVLGVLLPPPNPCWFNSLLDVVGLMVVGLFIDAVPTISCPDDSDFCGMDALLPYTHFEMTYQE